MTLIPRYLESVRMFLPRGVPHDDILAELAEQLESMTEERESRLGRPLTEVELEQLLNEYGSPMIVAGRYGGGTRRLTFGGVLIGPELFPLYVRVLLLNWSIAIGIHALLAFVFVKTVGVRPFLTTIAAQFVGLTLTFSIIDRLQRRSHQRWYFPPAYLQPVARWDSAAGLIVCTAFLAAWTAIPFVRSLLPGGGASALVLLPGWYGLYWSVMLLAAVGSAQRAINLVRPDWNWLLPAVRLTTNIAALALIYVTQAAYPYVAVADPAANAKGLNDLIWWALVGVAPFYCLTHIGIWGCLFAQHVGHYLRRRDAARLQDA
jgi:hypothetical protein